VRYSNERLGTTKLATVVLNENINELKEIYDFCHENNIKSMMFSEVTRGYTEHTSMGAQAPRVEEILEQLPIITKDTKSFLLQDRVKYVLNDNTEITINPAMYDIIFISMRQNKDTAEILTPKKEWRKIDFRKVSFDEAHSLMHDGK